MPQSLRGPAVARKKGSNPYSPPLVDRIWDISGSCYNMPKAIFYLLKADYNPIDFMLV